MNRRAQPTEVDMAKNKRPDPFKVRRTPTRQAKPARVVEPSVNVTEVPHRTGSLVASEHARARIDGIRKTREENERQDRVERDKQPVTAQKAVEQIRAYAEMPSGVRLEHGAEIGGSLLVRLARQGAFASYPEARRLLVAHDAKGPAAPRRGAWYDFVIEVRKQLGKPSKNLLESFPEDAALAIKIIERDPAFAGSSNPSQPASQSDAARASALVQDLNASEASIIEALVKHGTRLTSEPLLMKAHGKSGGHGKGILASLVKRRKLTSHRDRRPPGYGLPWWP